MSVSEESDGDRIGDERLDGVANAHHVFIFVERGAMDKLDAREFVELNGPLGESAEPVKVGAGELVAGPKRSEAGDGIEVLEVHEAADGLVVIAADEDASQGLRFGDDLVGIAAVADRIAKIGDEVVGGRSGETGVERFEIAVNVA
jgi:hypothetical protein